ncbi:MAG: hypothetical protein JSR26_07600 [Proteobacteria bacterium]|nr:hypothetical protein [Pseudomonadota bacterium]
MDFDDDTAANPKALKLILGLGGVFVLVLLLIRVAGFLAFFAAMTRRAPFILVEPGTLANLWLLLAMLAAPLVFLLPRAARPFVGGSLVFVALIAVALGGNATARGGAGLADTTVGHWLQSRGYARCAAGDRIEGGGRTTHGEYVAEGWAQPGGCAPAFFGASATSPP